MLTAANEVRPAPCLSVSIHDVAPHTWPACERLIEAVRAVAPIPLTLLVVPDYHRRAVSDPVGFRHRLDGRLGQGDELALHGYNHLDEAPRATTWRERYWREVFTLQEGEFAALSAQEARWRLRCGLAWFAQRGWPVEGFVPPAWLMGRESWCAVTQLPFRYMTTLRHFHLLPECRALYAPTLAYSTRNAPGRWLCRRWMAARMRRWNAAAHLPLADSACIQRMPISRRRCGIFSG